MRTKDFEKKKEEQEEQKESEDNIQIKSNKR